MRPVNLYSAEGDYLATVLVPDDLSAAMLIEWKKGLFQYQTPDRYFSQAVFVVAGAVPLHERVKP